MEGDGIAQSTAIVPFDGGGDVGAFEPGAFLPEEGLSLCWMVVGDQLSIVSLESFCGVFSILGDLLESEISTIGSDIQVLKHTVTILFAYLCKSSMQEMWLAVVNDIIEKIPVVLDDDDVATEKARDMQIQNLRRVIAHRWVHLFEMKSQLPRPDWDGVCNEVSQCLSTLIEKHGEEIPFAPDMKQLVPLDEPCEVPPIQVDSTSSSGKDSQNSKVCMPHEFRWLELRKGVWTDLQASNQSGGFVKNNQY